MFDTAYLTDLTSALKFVASNRATLTEAAIAGNNLASCILDSFYLFIGGDYRKSQIEDFNEAVAEWQNSHA